MNQIKHNMTYLYLPNTVHQRYNGVIENSHREIKKMKILFPMHCSNEIKNNSHNPPSYEEHCSNQMKIPTCDPPSYVEHCSKMNKSYDPPTYWDHCVRYLSIPSSTPAEEDLRCVMKSFMEIYFASFYTKFKPYQYI